MSSENVYAPPESDLGKETVKKGYVSRAWRRLYISFIWAYPVFMFFVIAGTPRKGWAAGAIGSLLFSFGTGLLAAFIQSDRKVVFVPISILVGVTTAAVIGIYFGRHT